jgi:adenine/guanine/hypoxanthine permease
MILDRFFKLSERGTGLRTEVMAGLTTFMTMACIMFVNLFTVILHRRYRPARRRRRVRGDAWRRLPRASLELFTNFLVALIPGLGINAIVAFRSSPARAV